MKLSRWLLVLALCLLVGVVSADTLILFAEYDGQESRAGVSENWADIRNGTGNEYAQVSIMYAQFAANTSNPKFAKIRRTGLTFNTTNVSSWDTINSAVVSLKGVSRGDGFGVTPSFRLVRFTPANALSFGSADYSYILWNETSIANNIAYASYSTSAYNNFTLTDLTAITKGGYTTVGVRIGGDALNIAPEWASAASSYFGFAGVTTAGTGSDPILTLNITYGIPPDTSPPASITNLANSTTTCEAINFTWTNPVNADYNGIKYWLNDTLQSPNLTNTTTHKLFTGLTGGTSYTFSTKTFDLTGNLNASFVNMTAIPTSCIIAPVASFTSNVTSGVAPLAVGFTDTSTNTPIAWNWSFRNATGNNTIVWFSTAQNPTITLGVGNWSFALNASNSAGYNITPGNYWVNMSAAIVAPVSSFIANTTSGIAPLAVGFTDTSTNTPTSWLWDFGEGNTSVEQNPIFTYDACGGIYTVTLTATNAAGSDDEIKVDYITTDACPTPTPTPVPTPPIANPIRQNRGQMIDLITWLLNLFRSKLV